MNAHLKSAIEFACNSEACAPPPVGTGGSISSGKSGGGSGKPSAKAKAKAPASASAPSAGSSSASISKEDAKAMAVASRVSGPYRKAGKPLPGYFTKELPPRPKKEKWPADEIEGVASKQEMKWAREENRYLRAKAIKAAQQAHFIYTYNQEAAMPFFDRAEKLMDQAAEHQNMYGLPGAGLTINDYPGRTWG